MNCLVLILGAANLFEKLGDILEAEFHTEKLTGENETFGSGVGVTVHARVALM